MKSITSREFIRWMLDHKVTAVQDDGTSVDVDVSLESAQSRQEYDEGMALIKRVCAFLDVSSVGVRRLSIRVGQGDDPVEINLSIMGGDLTGVGDHMVFIPSGKWYLKVGSYE